MEEKAFSEIAVRLRGKAVGTALACGLDAMQADDVAQDAMLKLWNMRDQLDRYRSLEALTVGMTRPPAASSSCRCPGQCGARRPALFTTRWQGM